MLTVIVITESFTNEFITILNKNTNLLEWAEKYIEDNSVLKSQIDFWDSGSISTNEQTKEIIFSGDNGMKFFSYKLCSVE